MSGGVGGYGWGNLRPPSPVICKSLASRPGREEGKSAITSNFCLEPPF